MQDWMIPLVETLTVLPTILLFIWKSYVILYVDNFYICSFGKFALETAIIERSVIFMIIAIVYFVAKIMASFFMIKKFKWGYTSIILLYFLDMIASLVIFCTSKTTLQEWDIKDLLINVIALFVTPAVICFLTYSFLGKLNKKRKTKWFKIFCSTVFSVVIIAIGVMWFNGGKQIATDEEIATLNRCYEYSEQYLYKTLPDDKETLETMQSDIEEVFEKELFFTAFNKSKYFDCLKEIQKTNDYATPIITKSIFANDLMYLKSKILLKLDKDDEYVDYYIETRRWFSTAEVEFFYKYLEQDVINYSNNDCEVVKKACAEFMNEDVNRIEKFWATIDYSKVAGKDLTKEEREEISKAFRKEHLPDYDNDKIRADLLELEEYKAIERTLYMLK